MSKKLFWKTEKRKVKDLIQYKKNPRKLSEDQLEGLKRSLKKFNVAELPCINTDGTLVAGNQRVLALSLLGRDEDEIEVRVPNRPLTEAEFRDYLLTSNRSGASWDFEKLASDFDIDELLTAGFDSLDLENIFDNNLEVVDDDVDIEKELKEQHKEKTDEEKQYEKELQEQRKEKIDEQKQLKNELRDEYKIKLEEKKKQFVNFEKELKEKYNTLKK